MQLPYQSLAARKLLEKAQMAQASNAVGAPGAQAAPTTQTMSNAETAPMADIRGIGAIGQSGIGGIGDAGAMNRLQLAAQKLTPLSDTEEKLDNRGRRSVNKLYGGGVAGSGGGEYV